jgi:hypothetical protein
MTGPEYLAQHGITEEFAKSIGITWDDKFLNIPVNEDGVLWYKRRNLNFDPDDAESAKYINDPGSKATIFNLSKYANTKTLVLTEGEMDAIKLNQEGIAAISVTSGAEKFDKKFAKKLKDKNLYICYDNDDAGLKGITKVLEFLPYTKVITLPPFAKDICEFFSAGHVKKEFTSLKPQTYEEWLIANEPEQFAFVEGCDLVKRDIPKEEWLIDRVLPVEGFTFFVGAEATGKSFLTLTLAEAVTTGRPWLGKFDVKKQTNVLFIDKENTKRRTQSRMKGLGMSGEHMFWIEYPQFFEVSDEKETDGFSQFVKSVARKVKKYDIGLIIIDSFTDVMVGNENAAGDTQRFFDGFRQLFPGISILVLHHENKPQQGTPRTASQRVRGSTNITAQIIVGFRTEALFKSKGEFTIEQTKVGDAEKLPKFKLKMETTYDVADHNKTIVTALKYLGEATDEVAAVDKAADFVLLFLKENEPASRQDIIENGLASGETKASIVRALDMLKEKKIISGRPDPKNKSRKLFSTIKGYEESLEEISQDPNSIFNGEVL